MNRRTSISFLIAFYVLCYILLLGVRDLAIPDETRYAEIPREMISTGEWVSPRLNGVRYFEKPVLGYWLHAISLRIFGENNFGVRFPSALSVGLTGSVLYLLIWATRRKTSDQESGKRAEDIAVLVLFSSVGVFAVGNTALLDNLFSLFVTASIAAFFLATEAPKRSPKERWFLIAAGASCGLAFLTKGFIAFALPVLVFVPYLIRLKRAGDIFRLGVASFLAAGIVAAPWAVLIHIKEPDYWHFFFWNEHVRRFFAENAQHSEPFWFFFAVGALMLCPWSFFLPSFIVGLRDNVEKESPRGRLKVTCILWFLLPFLFFSLSRGKLLTYFLPCIPPFAVLVALGFSSRLDELSAASRKKWFSRGAYASLAFFAILVMVFLYVQFSGFDGVPVYLQRWKIIFIIAAFLFFALFCIWATQVSKFSGKAFRIAISPLFFFIVAHFLVPDLTIEVKMPGGFLEKHRAAIEEDTAVVTDGNMISAVCWYLKRDDVYVFGHPGELEYGFTHDRRGRNIGLKQFNNLVERRPGGVVLIARKNLIDRFDSQVLTPLEEHRGGLYGYLAWRKY